MIRNHVMSSELLYALSERWIPNELLVRNTQLNMLLENSKSKMPYNYWITGGSGSGKSLVAKIYNNMVHNSYLIVCSSKSFKETVKAFAFSQGIAPKSTENPVSTIMSVLSKGENKESLSLSLIFDDVDKLERYFKRDFSSYLHDLYDRLLSADITFSINIVTNISFNQIDNCLSQPTISRLKFKSLNFRRYSKDEIVILLKQRLGYIKDVTVEENALAFIGEKISGIGGDFRQILDIAKESLKDSLSFSLENVKRAWIFEKEGFWKDRILELPYHQALILVCIVEETLAQNAEIKNPPYLPVNWLCIKNRYQKHCKELNIQPLRPKMQYYWLEYLKLKEWVEKFVLPSNHEWNYMHQKSLHIRLTEKLENLEPPIEDIDWKTQW